MSKNEEERLMGKRNSMLKIHVMGESMASTKGKTQAAARTARENIQK